MREKEMLVLRRQTYWHDCTIGTLTDSVGNPVCMTMEPTWRGSRHSRTTVMGHTAIPTGTYRTNLCFDALLHYQCLHLTNVPGCPSVAMCFHTKDGSKPHQTKGDILLGMQVDSDRGMIADALTAFERLMEFHRQCRTKRRQLWVKVCDAEGCRPNGVFGNLPHHPTDLRDLFDYELQTI